MGKHKRMPRQVEKRPVFKEPEPVLERLAWLVNEGRISEEQATDAYGVDSLELFTAYCIRYQIGRIQ